MDSNNSKDDNKNTDIQNIPDNFIPLLKLFFEGKKMREF
jgi:poly(A) polymerase Pap1